MRAFMGADSLAFLSVAGIYRAMGFARARPPAAAVHRSLLHRRLPDPAHRPGRRAGERTPAAARRSGLKLRALDRNGRRRDAWRVALPIREPVGNGAMAARSIARGGPTSCAMLPQAANLHSSVTHGRDTEGSPSQGAAPMSAVTDVSMPGAAPPASGKPHLDHPMDIRLALGILAVLAGGLFYMAYSIHSDIADVRRRTDDDPAVLAARSGAADRARLRIRQRFPRHRQRRRDRHLHPRPAGAVRRRLVGVLEPARRAGVERRRRLRHRFAACRSSSSCRSARAPATRWCSRCLIAAIIWNLGTWLSGHPGLQLAYADRLDCRRRRRQRAACAARTGPPASIGTR